MEEIKEGYYEFNKEILQYWKSQGYKSIISELLDTEHPYDFLEENAVLITPSFDTPHSVSIEEEFPIDNNNEDINDEYVLRLATPIDLVIYVVKQEYIKELL